jgi:hypothetical protein
MTFGLTAAKRAPERRPRRHHLLSKRIELSFAMNRSCESAFIDFRS